MHTRRLRSYSAQHAASLLLACSAIAILPACGDSSGNSPVDGAGGAAAGTPGIVAAGATGGAAAGGTAGTAGIAGTAVATAGTGGTTVTANAGAAAGVVNSAAGTMAVGDIAAMQMATDQPDNVVVTTRVDLPGVIVVNNETRSCIPLCTTAPEPAEVGSDWAWEEDANCILPATQIATNQACVTGQAIPAQESRPGVVRSGQCYALCINVTEPTDAENPDWSYDNNEPCIFSGTKSAVAQACLTQQALPDPAELNGRDGVVTMNEDNARVCSPLCVFSVDVALDPDPNDWDFEYEDSCVIPNSDTALNQPCKTGEVVPGPLAKPGVVVVDGAGVAECTPLCVINSDPALDPEGDGWAYEDNSSCVIPLTAPAETNLACTTGDIELPVAGPKEGVVVKLEEDILECVPLCTFYTSITQDGADLDAAADDWAWEGNSECIIVGTKTEGANLDCTTLSELPTAPPTPGVYINSDPVEDSCTTTACVPLCIVVTEPEKPEEYPDWGWEFNESCILPGTPTATIIGGDSEKSIENHLYEVEPRACTWGDPIPDYMVPPALDTARLSAKPYFHAEGDELLDAYGEPFVIRAINNSNAWYDICGQYSAFTAIKDIAETGANSIRIGWAFESIDPGGPGGGEEEKSVIGTNANLLAEILYETVRLGMVPIVAFNDSTGQTATSWPQKMADFLLQPEYLAVFKAYEPYMMLGIANELNVGNGDSATYASSYNGAIASLRDAGLRQTLVITANEWGQGCYTVSEAGAGMITSDSESNLLFDLHIYTYLHYPAQDDAGNEASRVEDCLNDLEGQGIPTMVGEFGEYHGEGENEKPVAWEAIINTAKANGQGYAPWLWYGDTEYPALNMNTRWYTTLTDWGSKSTADLAGSPKASIFE